FKAQLKHKCSGSHLAVQSGAIATPTGLDPPRPPLRGVRGGCPHRARVQGSAETQMLRLAPSGAIRSTSDPDGTGARDLRRDRAARYPTALRGLGGVARTPHCTSRAFCRDRNSNPSPIARRNHPVNTPCGCRMGANDERLDVAARDADAQPRPGRNMIEYRNVRKIFDEGTHAVEDFSLTIESRTTTVFVGSSGCGKTTLLRMVNRMVDPSAGSVLIDDVD